MADAKSLLETGKVGTTLQSPEDQRESDRLPVPDEPTGEVMVFQPMAVKQVSRGGAEIDTGFQLQLDSLHEFRLPLGEHSVVVKARVVHCRIADLDQDSVLYRTGIEFVEPSEHVRAVIDDFTKSVGPTTPDAR
jgi:hypothetical protein